MKGTGDRARRIALARWGLAIPAIVLWLAVALAASGRAGEALLTSIVVGGRVDYELLDRRRDDLGALLAAAERTPPESLAAWTDDARLAFYLNTYNLATLDLISRERRARGGRLRSIQEIPGAWSRPRWKVAGARHTLDEIEHEILRKKFREPRIHMALVCASISCPPLRSEPYDGERLGRQLDAAASAFLNDSTRNDFTPRQGRVRISKIFDWYGGDFVGVYRDSTLERLHGAKNGAVLAFASRYLPKARAMALREVPLAIDYLPYDWGLNAANAGER
jgi:hypothetical protein